MKPKVLVSKCIGFDHCRYDGSMISSSIIEQLKEHVDFVPVCPEVEMGLSIPRHSIRLVLRDDQQDLVDSMTGENHTFKMVNYIENFHWSDDYVGAILKNRSPSCGIGDVKQYKSHGKVPCLESKSDGVFGAAVKKHLVNIPIEDEGRLTNYILRDQFLTGVFRLHAFRVESMRALIEYHSNNKYLLMAYNQQLQKTLGRIVANHENHAFTEVKKSYYAILKKLFQSPTDPGKNENVILHMFGYFSDNLTTDEKSFFFNQLKMYRQYQLPLTALMTVMYSWILRFNIDYLKPPFKALRHYAQATAGILVQSGDPFKNKL
jgi:uncharacterized protein YbbK (DUF523 family)/uncharacterized protein YbgA (DUF1722 family)